MSTTQKQKVTAAAWKKNAVHDVVCPSGTTVAIKIPDLPSIIEAGQIPQHLLDVALGSAASGQEIEPTRELIAKQREFTDLLVMKTVVEPTLTPEDVMDVPYEDKEFLVQVAMRQRDLDAVGDHIGGLSNSEKFLKFRRLGRFDTDVEGL